MLQDAWNDFSNSLKNDESYNNDGDDDEEDDNSIEISNHNQNNNNSTHLDVRDTTYSPPEIPIFPIEI